MRNATFWIRKATTLLLAANITPIPKHTKASLKVTKFPAKPLVCWAMAKFPRNASKATEAAPFRRSLTVIHAQEQKTPKNRKKIDWKLLTDLPVQSRKDAIEKLEWYAMRWKIEMFHKILKSGCKAEELRLRTADRLANLISLFCILSWRIFWMTMLNRSTPTALPSAALTETEIELLDHLVKDEAQAASRRKTLSQYLIKIAKLGGYLARANDPPPGNIVMWRGLSRLTDIGLGAAIGARIVGN